MSAEAPLTAPRRVGPGWWAAVVAIAAAGAWVRLRGVADLQLILDERLVLRGIHGSLLDALVNHTMANNSPALTLYARALERAGALDELTLRLPMLVSGLGLLALPLLLARRLGAARSVLYLALLASSAPLVYFSFVARPYAPALLAIGIALHAWDRVSRGGGRAAQALLGSASGLAVFLHAFAAPVVAGLFAASLLDAARGRLAWRAWGRAVAWAAATGALLLGPGAASFLSAHAGKLSVASLSADLPIAIFEQLALGIGDSAVWVALALALGLVGVLQRDPALARAGCLALAFPALALALLRPLGGVADWARYALLAWPIALLFAADGSARLIALLARAFGARRGRLALLAWAALALLSVLAPTPEPGAGERLRAALAPFASWGAGALVVAAAVERLAGAGRGAPVAAVLLVVGTLALSPLRLYRQTPDSFRSHPEVLRPATRAEAPAFYQRLARDPDAGTALLECPDPGNLIHSAPYARYQQTHRKRVLLLSPLPDDFRRGFRNLVDVGDDERQRRSGARYALVHRDLNAELWGGDAAPLVRFDAHANACREALRAHWGAPVYRDDQLEAFDLRAPERAPGGMR